VSKKSILNGGRNIGVFVSLVQKCVMLFVEISERGCRGNDVGGIAKEHEKGVEEGNTENEIMRKLMNQHPLCVASKSTNTVSQGKNTKERKIISLNNP